MSESILKAANQLLKEKEYNAARAILETISSNPTAKEWLLKLDKISPSENKEEPRESNSSLVALMSQVVALLEEQRDEMWEYCDIWVGMPNVDYTDPPAPDSKIKIGIFAQYYQHGDAAIGDGEHTISDEIFDVPFSNRFEQSQFWLKVILADHGRDGYEVISIQYDAAGRPNRFFLKRRVKKSEYLKSLGISE